MRTKKWIRTLGIALLTALAVCLAAGLALPAAARLGPEPGWGGNGSESTFDGVKYGNPGADFYRGYDADGNLCFQNVTENGSFVAYSDRKVLFDGLNYTFKAQSLSGTPENNTMFFMGLTKAYREMPAATLVFAYNGTDFDLYWMGAALAHPYAAAGNKQELSQYAVGTFAKPKFDEWTTVQIKKLTAEDAAALSAELAEGSKTITAGYHLIINGTVLEMEGFDAFITSAGSRLGAPSFDYQTDDNGDLYGYFVYGSQYWNNELTGGTEPSDFAVRVSFQTISDDGTDSGFETLCSVTDAATYPAGVSPTAGSEDFFYHTARTGAYQGKRVYRGTDAYGFAFAEPAKVNGFEYAATADVPTDGTLRIALRGGDQFAGVELTKLSASTAAVSLMTAAGKTATQYTAESPLSYPWGKEQLAVNFFLADDSSLAVVSGNAIDLPAAFVEVLTGFAEGKANAEVTLPQGGKLVEVNYLADGSAVKKTIVTGLSTVLVDQSIACGNVASYPASVKVAFDDGTSADWSVTWNETVKHNTPGKYTVTGTFTDLATLSEQYYISSRVLKALTFGVTVNYPQGFVNFTDTAYGSSGSRWVSSGGGDNHFLYRRTTESETFLSDGFKDTPQFMPADTLRKDVDDYAMNFAIKAHSDSVMFGIMMMPAPKHPVEFGTAYIGVWVNVNANSDENYLNITTSAGDKEAYLCKEGKDAMRTFRFDASGKTFYTLTYRVEDGKVHLYFTIGKEEYEIRIKDGDHYVAYDQLTTVYDASFEGGKGYTQIWNQVGYSEVSLRQDFHKYIVSYDKPENRVVDFGAEHGLPTMTDAYLNDGQIIKCNVLYSDNYDKETAGSYDVTGTLSYTGSDLGNGVTIFEGAEPEFRVTVTVREETLTITAFEAPETVKRTIGEEAGLPTTFLVTVHSDYFHRDEQREITVVWTGDYNRLAAGDYVLTAQPVGNYRFADTLADAVRVHVMVSEPEKKGGCKGAFGADGGWTALCAAALLGCGLLLGRRKQR